MLIERSRKREAKAQWPGVVAKMAVLPAVFYLTSFVVLTYPLIRRFSTHLFADPWDGVVFQWDLWWVNKALTELHQSPWHTAWVDYPFGVSLLPHTLNVFNGLLAIPLLRFFTLRETYNLIVIFSFTACGVTTFLLAYHLTRSYWPSILAGFVFTFCSYHFAHMEGHLNLVSIEWLPLFILCWYVLLARPGIGLAIAAGLVLFAVILCDYYYFFYCILVGAIIFLWHGLRTKNLRFFLDWRYALSLAVFLAVVLLTSGPIVISLLQLSQDDPISGHDPRLNSMDALAPFIPGSHWRFAKWTSSYWKRLRGDANENSVYLGWSVIVALVYIGRRRARHQELGLWFFILFCFAVLSLGPALHVWGKEYSAVKLPYAILESIFPPIQVSGVPVRMMVISTLAASVLCAASFAEALRGSRRERALAALAVVTLFVEYLPKSRITSGLPVPGFANVLKVQPGDGAVVDIVSDPFEAMFDQTIHEKPMAFGELSRTPRSVVRQNEKMRRLISEGDYVRLHDEFHIRYLVMAAETNLGTENDSVRTIFADAKVNLYELGKE